MSLLYQNLYQQVYGKRDCSDVISAIDKFCDTSTEMTVYDVGCGQGRLFAKLRVRFKQYYGIDIDQDALAKFRSCFPEASISNKIQRDWLPADVFIFYFNVLNYFSFDEYAKFLEELRMNMNKKTILYFNYLFFDNFLYDMKCSSHVVTLDESKYLLSNKIHRKVNINSHVFEECIERDGEIIFQQKNNLFCWDSIELKRIHSSMGYKVSILSDIQTTPRNVETIMEISA